jgi:phosphohistidine phosphatase
VAKQVWLLRHGDAEPHGTRPDAERKLTDKGEIQSRNAGAALARLGLNFDAIYASPRVRALDTARLASESIDGEVRIHDPLNGGFDRAEADQLLAGAADGERVLLVGHEPDFSQLVHDLTGAHIDLKKGGIAAVRLEPDSGELFALLRPREIELLAG